MALITRLFQVFQTLEGLNHLTMKQLVSLALISILASVSFSQNTKIDSLLGKLKTEKEDTNKVMLLNDLSKEYRITDFKMAEQYANKALKLAKKIHFKKGIARA